MDQQDKRSIENIVNALYILPANKQEYLIGVADGMIAMLDHREKQPNNLQVQPI